jgi:hemolysin activation/secretion protein
MFACIGRIVSALALVAASTAAIAQVSPGNVLPGRERERFTEPTAPLSQPGGAAISLPSTQAPPGAERIKLRVRNVRVVGATVYTAEQLAPIYADLVGREVTLDAVYDLAQRITAKYGNDGYVISRAVVPPQQLNPGGAVVVIQVIEGYVDRVQWPPQLSKYRDFFSDYTAKIIAQRPTNIRTIERYLLLAGDLPGLKFTNSLKPSATHQGAATLVVEVVEKPIDALARVDNRGTAAQGPLEFLASATVNNLLRAHEAFTLTYAGPFKTEELKYIYGQYSQVLNSEGLSFFVDASDGIGRPGTADLQALNYRTKSVVAEAGLTYPFIRSREQNLAFTALWFMSNSSGIIFDDPATFPSTLDRLRGFRLKANADWADQLNGIDQVNAVFSQGVEGLGNTDNFQPLASRANGRVDFTKVEATVTRMQPLFANLSALIAAYGQYAGTPLLSPELCGYGGRVFGRAYDPSDYVSDSCFEVLGELRLDLPLIAKDMIGKDLTQVQLYGFADRGWLHNIAPDTLTPANMNAASAGGGLRLGWLNAVTADVSAAKAVEGFRNNWRLFFILAAKY